MVDELVTIKTFWNAVEAKICEVCLKEAGIQAFLNENARLTLAVMGSMKLNVKKIDAQRAIEVLKPHS